MDLNDFYVYVHISTETDLPFYIGFGRKSRIKVKTRRSIEWNEIADKGYYYGFLGENMSREDANLLEKFCIKSFKELGFNLVNKINGGSGNSCRKGYSDEYKIIIGNRSREFWNSKTPEYKNEFGKKMSLLLKGVKKPKRSDEHIKKQSLSHKGQIPWNKNKTNIYSEETLNKIRKNNRFNRPIQVFDLDLNLLFEFISISDASRELSIKRVKISKILTGKIKKNNTGYIFKYKEIE